MGKGSTILGLIGLILGAGGIGLGGIAWLSLSRIENKVISFDNQTTWYKENITNYRAIPASAFSGLAIEFELRPNESVFFSFNARAHVESSLIGWSFIRIYFSVDGFADTTQHAEVGVYIGDFTAFMISLQDVRHNLSPGVHSVTVYIIGSSAANYIHESTLFVRNFPTNLNN